MTLKSSLLDASVSTLGSPETTASAVSLTSAVGAGLDETSSLLPEADRRQLLLAMGNALDAIDDVRENNGIGFNKIDKATWQFARRQTSAVEMRGILKKYFRQISSMFSAADYRDAGLGNADDSLHSVFLTVGTGGLEVALSGSRLPQESFSSFVLLHKNLGFKFSSDIKLWVLPTAVMPGFNYEQYKNAILAKFRVTVAPLPANFAEAAEGVAAQYAAESLARADDHAAAASLLNVEAVIRAIAERRLEKVLAIRRDPGGKFCIHFPFDKELVAFFSNTAGHITGITEFNPLTKARETYDLELAEEIVEKMAQSFPTWRIATSGLVEAREKKNEECQDLRQPIPAIQAKIAPGFSLFLFQNQMVRFIEKTKGCLLIGDEMGLGKTLQTLAWAAAHNKRLLVVCPKVVRRTWIEEATKFFPGHFRGAELSATRLRRGEEADLTKANIVTVNYESLGKFQDAILRAGFDAIVIDESHRIKNPKAKITKLIQGIARKFEHRLLLSGTSVKNRRDELYTQIELVSPGLFSSRGEINRLSIGAVWNRMQPVYLARQKRNVLKDLPPKLTSIVKNFIPGLPDWTGGAIGDVSRLKDQLARAKASQTTEFVREILESSESSVLVFSESLAAARAIHEAIGPSLSILHHGQLTDEAREAAKKEFQNPESLKRVLVSTRQSLAEGATLTRADRVVFNDLPWNASSVRQAEDRTHRPGQEKTVNVYWSVAEGNLFDEGIANLVMQKYSLTKRLNEGKQLTKEEREWMDQPLGLSELLDSIKKTRKPPGQARAAGPGPRSTSKSSSVAASGEHKYVAEATSAASKNERAKGRPVTGQKSARGAGRHLLKVR